MAESIKPDQSLVSLVERKVSDDFFGGRQPELHAEVNRLYYAGVQAYFVHRDAFRQMVEDRGGVKKINTRGHLIGGYNLLELNDGSGIYPGEVVNLESYVFEESTVSLKGIGEFLRRSKLNLGFAGNLTYASPDENSDRMAYSPSAYGIFDKMLNEDDYFPSEVHVTEDVEYVSNSGHGRVVAAQSFYHSLNGDPSSTSLSYAEDMPSMIANPEGFNHWHPKEVHWRNGVEYFSTFYDEVSNSIERRKIVNNYGSVAIDQPELAHQLVNRGSTLFRFCLERAFDQIAAEQHLMSIPS